MADAPSPDPPRESYLVPSLLVIAILLLVCGGAVLYKRFDTARRIDAETRAEIIRLQLETTFLRKDLAEYARLTGWDLATLEDDLARLKEEVGGEEDMETCADVLAAWRERCRALEQRPAAPKAP